MRFVLSGLRELWILPNTRTAPATVVEKIKFPACGPGEMQLKMVIRGLNVVTKLHLWPST